ncbi:hypothetical protein CR513_56342, partial [Mucuna pruriens]
MKSYVMDALIIGAELIMDILRMNVKCQTPQEAWSEVKPKVDHLRIFGNIAYAHVPNQGRSKLDDRNVKHVFIGYVVNSKGYKWYNPNDGKIIVSRDVEFDEEKT